MSVRAACLAAALILLSRPAFAQTADNLLLVVNANSPASVQIAEHYAQVRHVPDRNIVRLKTPETDGISRAEYLEKIEAPLETWLAKNRLQDQILYIVLTKGIPLRIDGTGGLTGTIASVDSELTLLYRQMVQAPVTFISRFENPDLPNTVQTEGTRFARSDVYFVTTLTRAGPQLSLLQRPTVGASVPAVGRIDNPYFLGDKSISEAARFSRRTSDLYLVTRLDGFSVDDVIKLIDRGVAPVRDGSIVLDQKAVAADRGGDAWLGEAAARLKTLKTPPAVLLEQTRAVATAPGPVLGYFSWGSNDPANQLRDVGLKFANGAIGGMFVSTDGRTFHEPPATWKPAVAGSTTGGQSLIGDLIREGITGISGNVTEPLLDAIVRPQILFPAYWSGFNLAESFYLATPFLSWQNIVIGDPLCAPFATSALSAADLDKGIDDSTGMPAIFTERRLAVLGDSNLKDEALRLLLKAQSLQVQERPPSEIRVPLEKATALEPRMTVAHLMLAQMTDAIGEVDVPIAHYQEVIAAEPDNAVALNNLAYLLADRRNDGKSALPLAERAYQLTNQAPIVADTLGWAHFKAGDAAAAKPLADRAAQFAPLNADVLIHTATVHAALNDLAGARSYLDAALKVDPKIADRPDVKALVARIRGA